MLYLIGHAGLTGYMDVVDFECGRIGVDEPLCHYIDTYQCCAGWKARLMQWNVDGYYEPLQTGLFGHPSKQSANQEALSWGEAEEIAVLL